MNNYQVIIKALVQRTICVNAENESEANEAAYNQFLDLTVSPCEDFPEKYYQEIIETKQVL
jgi:hypothetical protein